VSHLLEHDLHLQPRFEVTAKETQYSQLCILLNACSQPLANAKDVQAGMVKTYNKDTGTPALMVICPMYPRDEVSKKGSLLVLTNALESAGFLHKEGERRFRLGKLANNCRLILFGDTLTDDMMPSVKEHVILQLTDIGKAEYVSILDGAMNQSTHLNGMLHVKMHNLVVIYSLF
jgi:hypothetical protein